MHVDMDGIVKKMDLGKLIEQSIMSSIAEQIDIDEVVDDALEQEKLKELVEKRVTDIIEIFLSSDEGKQYVIEQFKESISCSDMLVDDRITEIIAEFLKQSLIIRQ